VAPRRDLPHIKAHAVQRLCRNAQGVAQNIRFEQFHPALPCGGNTIILGSKVGTDPVGAGH
jgi:hypothetical protein